MNTTTTTASKKKYQSVAKRLKEVERLTMHEWGFNLESIAAIMGISPVYVRTLQLEAGLRPGRKETVAESRQRIVDLVNQGMTNEVISDKLGISLKTISKARREAGIVCKQERQPTEQQMLTAKELLVDGASYEEVSRTIGFTPKRIRGWFPGYEYTRAQASQAASMSRQFRRLGKKKDLIYPGSR